MRAPPAAVWRVQLDSRWQALHTLLYGLAGAVLAVWAVQHAAQRWLLNNAHGNEAALLVSAVVVCLLISALAAACGWRRGAQAEGRILWTGQHWRWQAGDASAGDGDAGGLDAGFGACDVGVQAMLDTGNDLLLRVTASRAAPGKPAWPTRYLSLRGPQGQQPGERVQWAGFRAAVYSAASRQGGLVPPNSPLTE